MQVRELEKLTNHQFANGALEAKRLSGGLPITLGRHGESEDREDQEDRDK